MRPPGDDPGAPPTRDLNADLFAQLRTAVDDESPIGQDDQLAAVARMLSAHTTSAWARADS